VVLPSTNVAEMRQEKFYLKARKRRWEIAGWWVTVEYRRGTRIAGVSRRACSRLELEEDALHKYPGRAKEPVEALARLAAGNCSIAAAGPVVVALAGAVAVAPDVAADAAADAVAVADVVVVDVVAVAAAAVVAVPVAVAAEAPELEDFVDADHQMNHQTLT
jgi:hypothetical protein